MLWDHPLGFALEKPPGVQVLSDNWYPRVPVLAEALNYQARRGKGEMERLGIGTEGARAIITSEPDMCGLALFARDPETGVVWSNAYGSDLFELKVQFVSGITPQAEELECELPLARHFNERRMVISSRTGRKSRTRFRRLKRFGRYSLWEATMSYYRMHQLPLHAFEVGLAVLGDRLYSDQPELYLSQLKRRFVPKEEREEAPLYPGMAMFLASIRFPMTEEETVTVEAAPPKPFAVLLRQLERFASG